MKKFLVILIIVLLVVAGLYYWFFLQNTATAPEPTPSTESSNPFGGSTVTPSPGVQGSNQLPADDNSSSITSTPVVDTNGQLPILRQLSGTPVGGFMASTTASSTLARYIDRGVGHIYEAKSDTNEIPKISNTTVPRVYDSFWNRRGDNLVIRYMKDDGGTIVNFFGELRKVPGAASTTGQMPFEIKGKYLSTDIKEVAVSPKGDRIATINIEDGKGIGYISGFDESKRTKVFESPLTQVNLDWPEENTLALSTKAAAFSSGYLYLIDIKNPILKKVLGGISGLTAKVSADAKRVIYSANIRGITTYILNLTDNSSQEVVFHTFADKCVWSKLHTSEVYCAVPTELSRANYPDDWYKGNTSFNDQIWHLDTVTGDVQLIANPLKLSNELMDAVNLQLDPKENFLYFMNKRNLTLWSLDLTKSQ